MVISALTACQNDEVLNSAGYSDDPDAVVVKSSIGGLQSRANTIGAGDQFDVLDRIHISNVTAGAITGKDVAVYEYRDDMFKPILNDRYIVWVDGENRFEAYYPYLDEVNASYTSFTLPLNQNANAKSSQSYIGNADWMTAESQSAKTIDNTISLSFRHRLARVSVKITGYNSQYDGSLPEISAPTFSVPGVERDAAVTVADDAKVKGLMISDESGTGLHTFMAVLPAGKYSSGTTLMTVNVDGQVLSVRPSSYLTTEGLKAGYAYTVNLTVGKNTASISGISVADWNEGWNENGTAVEESAKVENAVITTAYPGQLTGDVLDKAATASKNLTIKGSELSSDDFVVLSTWLNAKNNEDNTVLYSISLEDATELPENAFFNVAIDKVYAPNVNTIRMHAFYQANINEIWLTKTGSINLNEAWIGIVRDGLVIYLNADKRIDGTGSPTVEISEQEIYGIKQTYYEWGNFGFRSKDYWRFVDEAGNIIDWDGNSVAN